jgi:hypothetical protein
MAAALGAGTMLSAPAQAAAAGPVGQLGAAADYLSLVEKSQYVYRGYRHCWYPSGWKGPGWYRCGARWRRGYGWGGPVGWNNWVYGPPAAVVVVPRGRYYYGGRYYGTRYWRGGRWYYR